MSNSGKQVVASQVGRSVNTPKKKRVKTQRRAVLLTHPYNHYSTDGNHTFQQPVRVMQFPLLNAPVGSVPVLSNETDFLKRINSIVPSSFDIVKRGNLPSLSL